jgi:hypothetical protein
VPGFLEDLYDSKRKNMPYGYTKPQQIGTDIWKDKGPEISPYHIEWGMSESILLAMVQ